MRRGDEGAWGLFARALLRLMPLTPSALTRTGSGRAASGRRTVVRWRVQAGWAEAGWEEAGWEEAGARSDFLPLTPSALTRTGSGRAP